MRPITLVQTSELRPHEEVRFLRVFFILVRICLAKHFSKPLLIDKRTNTILDGHHRFWAAKILGLKRIPCYCVDYLYDSSITVHTRRPKITVNKKTVIHTAIHNTVFPYKTSRHQYTTPAYSPVPLYQLRNFL